MQLETYPDSEMMMMDLANRIAGELNTCLLEHPWASLAVPGGSTPGPMFDALSAADLDWSRVHVLLTDERRVPSDHPRSNERLIRERLLTGRASAAQFVRLVPDTDSDWERVQETLSKELPISILLLGMGADMHTASLFPGASELSDALASDAPPLMALTPLGGDLEPRLSLTAPVLKGAMTTHVLITGDEKRESLARAQKLSPNEAPISLVLPHATVHWAP
ncbi:MAG: 6-phosphogluconolactonase [Boseongicola sp.]|nr:6-phosphogluconolactonase [Boseongicola sp.]NNL18415.1 6-phosphogluconolactonase [Boseongicola sp.]